MRKARGDVPFTVFLTKEEHADLKAVAEVYELPMHRLMRNAAIYIGKRMLNASIRLRPVLDQAKVEHWNARIILPNGQPDWDEVDKQRFAVSGEAERRAAIAKENEKLYLKPTDPAADSKTCKRRRPDPNMYMPFEIDEETGKVWAICQDQGPMWGLRMEPNRVISPALLRHIKRQQGIELTEEEHEEAVAKDEEVRNDDGSYRVLGVSE